MVFSLNNLVFDEKLGYILLKFDEFTLFLYFLNIQFIHDLNIQIIRD